MLRRGDNAQYWQESPVRPTGQLQFWVEPAKSMANEFEELVEQVTPGSLGSGVSGVAFVSCR